MATLSAAISTAVTKSLLANLSGAAAQKFNVNETEFREFLQGFLATQLVKGKGARAPRVDASGNKLPGRVSGYLLFSNDHRDGVKKSHPEMKFTDVGKELGRMWGALTEAQKAEWNARATAANAAAGITPTPAAAKRAEAATPAPAKAAATPAKSAAVKTAVVAKTASVSVKQSAGGAAAKKAVTPARKPVSKKHESEDDD